MIKQCFHQTNIDVSKLQIKNKNTIDKVNEKTSITARTYILIQNTNITAIMIKNIH